MGYEFDNGFRGVFIELFLNQSKKKKKEKERLARLDRSIMIRVLLYMYTWPFIQCDGNNVGGETRWMGQ